MSGGVQCLTASIHYRHRPILQLSAMDVWAPTTMKNAANCDTFCELHSFVSHQNFERTLRFWDRPNSILNWVFVNPTQPPMYVGELGLWCHAWCRPCCAQIFKCCSSTFCAFAGGLDCGPVCGIHIVSHICQPPVQAEVLDCGAVLGICPAPPCDQQAYQKSLLSKGELDHGAMHGESLAVPRYDVISPMW